MKLNKTCIVFVGHILQPLRAWLLIAPILFGTGCNEILGIEPGTLRNPSPQNPDGACNPQCPPIQSLAAGRGHTCVIADGDVFCWGDNSQGQLGYGNSINRGDDIGEMGNNLIKVDLGTDHKATAIALGDSHTCALLESGAVKCWGGNTTGVLGVGDIFNRGDEPGEMGDALPTIDLGPGEKVKAIAAGDFHTCALLESNRIKCWGLGGSGQLGLGNGQTRGDALADMGVNLYPVDFGSPLEIVGVNAGGSFSCAHLIDGSIRCWGANGYGQLGLGDQMARGDNANELGSFLPVISLGTSFDVKSLKSGGGHTCASDTDSSALKCWGRNDTAQLGLGDIQNRGDGSGEMGDNLPALLLSNDDAVIKSQAAGARHHCVILEIAGLAQLKCWGDNSQGQCGSALSNFIGDNTNETSDQLQAIDLGEGGPVRDIAAGGSHTCAVLSNEGLKCWGDNTFGQLGYGDALPRNPAIDTMINKLPFVALPQLNP